MITSFRVLSRRDHRRIHVSFNSLNHPPPCLPQLMHIIYCDLLKINHLISPSKNIHYHYMSYNRQYT